MIELFLIIVVVAVFIFFKSSLGKGIVGEGMLHSFLGIALNKNEYQLLKDVTLPTDNGTTQIDHIVVSRYGVFVIETKNYKGWIFGDAHSKKWTQSIYGKKHTFQNPLHQNYKHTKTLQRLLNLNENKIFSVVVFVGNSTFKTNMPDNVVRPRGLLKFIKAHKAVILSHSDVERIIKIIENSRFTKGYKTNKAHIQNLKTTSSMTTPCPRCGSDLVLRTAKKGSNAGKQFYGCKSYPKCRYTKKLKELK